MGSRTKNPCRSRGCIKSCFLNRLLLGAQIIMQALYFEDQEIAMKFLALISFISFMVISIYVLLNEEEMKATHKKNENFKPVRANKIGEIHRSEIQAYELQKQRIDETSIYKFVSLEKGESYEMDEDDMKEFSLSMKALSDIKNAGRIEQDPVFEVSTKVEKEYYEVGN